MTLIQIRRGTSTQWADVNPVLAVGEPGYATDTGVLKIGDGSTHWSALAETADDDLAADVAGKLTKTANLTDLPDVAAARTALGLGPAATKTMAQIAADAALTAAFGAGSEQMVSAYARALAGRAHRLPPVALSGVATTTPAYTNLLGMLRDGISKVFCNSSFSASQIGVSADGVTFTWGKDFAGGNGIAEGFQETAGGEVLVAVKHRDNTPGKLWRSTGWNPATANATSWTAVLTASGTGVSFDGRWCLTQRSIAPRWSARAGAVFVTEYGSHISEATSSDQAAIRAYMSTDDGATWTTIFDLRNFNTDTNAHNHAIAYDPFDDRLFISVGDNANAGVYYCNGEDLGSPVWHAVTGTTGSSAAQSTTIVPLLAGVLLLSDSPNTAVRRLPRAGYRSLGAIEAVLTIATGGTGGIGAHAYQSDAFGPVLLSFYSSTTTGAPSIYATMDGRNIVPVYTEGSSVTTGPGIHSVVGPDVNGKVWATRNMTGSGALLSGGYVQPGVTPPAATGVAASRKVATGAGITGGGDLSADRTLTAVSWGSPLRRGLIAHVGPEDFYINTSTGLPTGTLLLMKVVAEDDAASAARVVRYFQGTGTATGQTSMQAAVFDSTGAQLGSTSASDAGSASSHRNLGVGTFALVKGNEYYVGLLFIGTTGPSIARGRQADAASRMGLTGAALLFATGGTGLSAMPASFTPSALATLDTTYWVGLL